MVRARKPVRLTTAELPVYAAAWLLAAEIIAPYPDGEVVPMPGRTDLLVRGGGDDLVTFVFGEEPELRSTALPPIPASEWAWPMPHRERRRLVSQLTRGRGVRERRGDGHPVGRVTAQVVARVLVELVMRGDTFGLMEPGEWRGADLPWLPQVSGPHADTPPSSAWLLHVRTDVIGVFRGGWFYTPRGETIDLHARYLAGASIHNLAETVLWPERPGSRPAPGWLPPAMVVDAARAGEDLSHASVGTLNLALLYLTLHSARDLDEDSDHALIVKRIEAEIDRRNAD